VTPLAGALGAEAGLQSAVLPKLRVAASVWTLKLNSELTLDNDASMIVPSGATRRYGVEVATNFRATESVLFDADFAWTHARYLDDPAGPYVPNALEKVASIGAEVHRQTGWFGGFRVRYFGAAPIAQDGTVRSRPSLQVYGEAGYHFTPTLSAVLSGYNLLNRRDHDIEYYYGSQLRGEQAPVNDVHFHPIDPLNLRLSILWKFSSVP
jgi:outer membrane receptor protein involved in Fe transport